MSTSLPDRESATRKALHEYQPQVSLFYDLGCELLEEGAYVNAVEAFTGALEHAHAFAEGYVKRAEAFVGLAEYAQALEDLRQALVLDPEDRAGIADRLQAVLKLQQADSGRLNRQQLGQLRSADAPRAQGLQLGSD